MIFYTEDKKHVTPSLKASSVYAWSRSAIACSFAWHNAFLMTSSFIPAFFAALKKQ
jgi:hypothetical protein